MNFGNKTTAEYVTTGGFAGGPGYGVTNPATRNIMTNTDGGVAAGLAGGVGGGLAFSNANNPNDVTGLARSYNVDMVLFSGSLSVSDSGIFQLNLGLGFGKGWDYSSYPTMTKLKAVRNYC
jgi:hypothetical protein